MANLVISGFLRTLLCFISYVSADCYLPNGEADYTYNECFSDSVVDNKIFSICCHGWDACLSNNVCGHLNYTDLDTLSGAEIVSYYRGTCSHSWDNLTCPSFCLGVGYPQNPDDLMGSRATWVMGKCPAMKGDEGKERWYCMTDEEGGDKKSYGTEADCTLADFGFVLTQQDGSTGTESVLWTVFQQYLTATTTHDSAGGISTTTSAGSQGTSVTVPTSGTASSSSDQGHTAPKSTSTHTIFVTVWPSDSSTPTSWVTIQRP